MATKNNESLVKEADVVETEIAKGEQDDLLEDYPRSKRERIQKLRSKAVTSRIIKDGIPRFTRAESASRIKDLARPKKQHVLITLRERGQILPPIFVDNLIRIIEAESCLTPEEAAQIRRKRRKAKIKKRLPRVKKWMQEDMEDTILNRDAVMCQYLMAKQFVKSILEYQCCTPKKDVREIADVIMRRLMPHGTHADTRNDDRATQQLRLLADVVACWIAEILVEVANTRKHALEEYCRKRKRKMEIDENDEVANNETQDSKQTELKEGKERQEKREDINTFKTEKESEISEKENKNENEEQKRENTESEALMKDEEEVKQQIDEEVTKEKNDKEQTERNMEITEEFKEEKEEVKEE